ncbi:MAG: hypothetical protein AB1861_18920 [Cyanobacteriota bacterium]
MNFLSKIKFKINLLYKLLYEINDSLQKLHKELQQTQEIKKALSRVQEAIGRIENLQLQAGENEHTTIQHYEFRVFSQWGEDGIIQFLLRHLEVPRKIFVEFGVYNYTESNTRFLLVNNNWSGLVIDSSAENISYIKKDPIYWQHNLKAVYAFVTKDNINNIISENGIEGEIGLLSIDIDGNDYWVWQAINTIQPAIVIIEYNFRFGKTKAVTVPYDENFERSNAHHSTLYYGASLKAIYLLAQQKGYVFIGCNSAGNNAFFVRKDLKPNWIRELTVEEGYVAGQFRESRDEKGELIYLSAQEEQKILSTLPLVEVEPHLSS